MKLQAPTTSKRRGTQDWANSTKFLLAQAKDVGEGSHTLCSRNAELQRTISDNCVRHRQTVDSLLRKRVEETRVLKDKVETASIACRAELAELELQTSKAAERLLQVANSVKLAENRVQVRNQKPELERIDDAAERALKCELDTLVTALHILQREVEVAKEHVRNMKEQNAVLLVDLKGKESAVQVDEACLEFGGNSPAVCRSAAGTPEPQPVSKSGKLPARWKRDSMESIAIAQQYVVTSQKIREILSQLLNQTASQSRKANHSSIKALKGKIDQSQCLKNKLDHRLRRVTRDLDMLQQEKSMLMDHLKIEEEELRTTKERLNLRLQRPAREAVQNPAQGALQHELEDAKVAIQNLTRKLDSVEVQILKLSSLKASILRDVRSKSSALKIDQQALIVDLTDAASAVSAPSSHHTHHKHHDAPHKRLPLNPVISPPKSPCASALGSKVRRPPSPDGSVISRISVMGGASVLSKR